MIKERPSYYQHYLENKFESLENKENAFSIEPYLEAWENYLMESINRGVFTTVKSKLVQLQFPIQDSLSKTDDYKNATLKGKSTHDAIGLRLNHPESIRLSILNGPVGAVPVLTIPDADDFADMVRALAYKNEPVKIPNSMGASLIRGLNNWDRIHALQKQWLQNNTSRSWSEVFKNQILPNKSLYQDTVMLLSKKPYSGVDHLELGLSKGDWLQKSMEIRKYHEYAHYFTLRSYGKMSKNMYDEILADYLGISMAYGIYNSDLFLKFIGLGDYPKYRSGGRLENYLEMNKLNQEEFDHLKSLCFQASKNIERFDKNLGFSNSISERMGRLQVLCQFGLKELAQSKCHSTLIESYCTSNFINQVG